MPAVVQSLPSKHALWTQGPRFELDCPPGAPPYTRRFFESGYIRCAPRFKELLDVHDVIYPAPIGRTKIGMIDLIKPLFDRDLMSAYHPDAGICLWRLACIIEYQELLHRERQKRGKPTTDLVPERVNLAYVGGMDVIIAPEAGNAFSLYLDADLPDEREWQPGTRAILPLHQ